jgi:pimeloyl-ACP methyl ester carboxylesterase
MRRYDGDYHNRKVSMIRTVFRFMGGTVGVIVLAIIVFFVSMGVQYSRNDRPIVLPAHRGPNAVGRVLADWKDDRRDRELMVFIWYPAAGGVSGRLSEYIPGAWGQLEARNMNPIPATRLQQIQVGAIEEAPIASVAMRVLVMLPGMGRIPAHYTALAEDLASQGYVVVGVTPTGSSDVVRFPDGHVVWGTEEAMVETLNDRAKAQKLVVTWAGDASFALDQLLIDSRFAKHIQTDRVGIFGHSFGGNVAAHALQLDARFSRAAVLDSAYFGEPIQALDKPLLIFECDKTNERHWDAICAVDKASCSTLRFPAARHMNFSDAGILPSRFPIPKSVLMLGDVDGTQFLREVSDRLQAFFNEM